MNKNTKLLNESIDGLVDIMEQLIDLSDVMNHSQSEPKDFSQKIHDHAHNMQQQLRKLAEYRDKEKIKEL